MIGGPQPLDVLRTTDEARRGRAWTDWIAVRFPWLLQLATRLALAAPHTARRRRLLVYATSRAYAAFSRGDWEVAFAAHDSKRCVLEAGALRLPGFRDTYRGAEGLLEFSSEWIEGWDHSQISVEDVIDVGPDQILVTYRERGLATGSGISIEEGWADLIEFERGLVVRQRLWPSSDEARRELGLAGER